MSLRDHLQAIYDRDGKLTAEQVLTEARNPDHPLHERFEWNDDAAAEQWRIHQAGELIRSVKVVYREATEKEPAATTRAFPIVRGPDGNSYRPVEEVVADPLMKTMVLRDMERDWKTLKRRYEHLSEFADMVRDDIQEAA